MKTIKVVSLCVIFALLMCQFAMADSDSIDSVSNQIAHHISTQEWLGPIAAIALSPFFGLTCLSGLATYGPDFLTSHSALLSEGSPMNNPVLFWTMAGLTTLTSLPRFAKISKPISLLAEKLEAYSAIIILCAMRFSPAFAATPIGSGDGSELAMAGLSDFSVNVMMSIAAAVNLIVINTVKLGIEFLIWLIPIPLIDSFFEIVNKSLCGGLAFLYAYNPWLSAAFNLALFIACALVFIQVSRLLQYVKGLYVWPILMTALGRDLASQTKFQAFTKAKWQGIPARSAIAIVRRDDDTLEAHYDTWMNSKFLGAAKWQLHERQLLTDLIEITIGNESVTVEIPKGILVSGTVTAVPS